VTTIKIHYDKRTPQVVEEEEVVSGQRETISILFDFSAEWNNFPIKTAVFTSVAAKKSRQLDDSGMVDIPEEVIINGVRNFEVSVSGVTEEGNCKIHRYNGKPVKFAVTRGGEIPGNDTAGNCKPSAYEQLLIRVNSKLDANQGVENAGRAMVVGDDGILRPGDYAGGGGGAITPGIENAGKLLYVDESGNGAFLQLGDGLEIRNGRLCIVGTVTPDEPAEAIAFEQTGENSVAVSGVVFEQQEDGTVLWGGATFTPGEENTVVIK
jgi:hypothetical protein